MIDGKPVTENINIYLGLIVGDNLLYFPKTIDVNI